MDFPPSLQHLALQPRLTHRLQDAINKLKHGRQHDKIDIPQSGDQTARPMAFFAEAASFGFVKDLTQISYSSPIALKLSRSWNLPAADLAEQISACLTNGVFAEIEPPDLKESWKYLTTRVVPPGFIVVKLNDLGIALWLQMLANRPLQIKDAKQSTNDSNANSKSDHNFHQNADSLFEIQYIHARCCALLRMGIQAGLISSIHLGTSVLTGSKTRSTFPWLTDHLTLRLQNHAEKYLISQLFVTLDQLSTCYQPVSPSGDRQSIGLKLASSLSQRIENFYAVCRIFGDVQIEQVELAQARLGLILASKTLLSFLLQDWLEVAAPTEL